MPHHEESPEKPQYNMATPPPISRQPPLPILPNPLFLAKIFRPPPPFPSISRKSTPPFYKGVGLNYVRTTTGMQSGPDAFDKSRFITI